MLDDGTHISLTIDWQSISLKSPEELIQIGFSRSPVVMVNEAHDGMTRSIRTRRVGTQMVISAHSLGVRRLAMEALWDREIVDQANAERILPPMAGGYGDHPEMRALSFSTPSASVGPFWPTRLNYQMFRTVSACKTR